MKDKDYRVSLNQIVAFSRATKSTKVAIAKQQVVINPFLVPWYQLAKNRIKKYFHNTQELDPIFEAINILKSRIPNSSRQATDRKVSLEALQRIISLKIPSFLKGLKYEVVKTSQKSFVIGKVTVNVNPDIIIRAQVGGKTVYGGLKIHLSKGKPFDLGQCYNVASVLQKFISEKIAQDGEIVSPELCFCLDVFGDRLVGSPSDYFSRFQEVDQVCEEFVEVWDGVNK